MEKAKILNQMVGSLFTSLQTLSEENKNDKNDIDGDIYQSYLKSLGCTHQAFFTPNIKQQDQCWIALNNCGDEYDFVNFFQFCYCWLDANIGFSLFLSFILILLIFRFISGVVEEYLAPAISYLSLYLNLSDAMAAVTLLALANGAGDVITALVASGSQDGLSYNIGAIYGAGLFVTSIVVAMTIFNSPNDIQLEVNSIWRDVGMYIIATLTVILFGFIGTLTMVSAIVMLAEYVLLVLIVYYQDKQKPKEKDEEDDNIESPHSPNRNDLIRLNDDKTDEEKKASSNKWKNALSKINTATPEMKIKLIMRANFRQIAFMALKNHKSLEGKEKDFEDKDLFEKISFITDIPFDYARKVTLPPCEHEKYQKKWAVIFPIPGLLFILFAATQSPQLWWLAAIPIGLGMSLYIHQTSPEDKIPKYFPALALFGTIGALMWTYLISGILIDLLQFLGMLSKLDKTYLGLTVIAVGNALPDAVTTIALAKQGLAIMGLTGAYAGQLFGLLVGFGIALLRKTYQDGPQVFDIFNPDKVGKDIMDIIVIMVALGILVITFVFGVFHKYKFNRLLARVLGLVYILFIVICTIIALKEALE